MNWHLHYLDSARMLVWTSDGAVVRAIAATADGVHPRLDRQDHRAQTLLPSAAACRAYANERGLVDDELAVLLSAATAVPYLQRGEVAWIHTEMEAQRGA